MNKELSYAEFKKRVLKDPAVKAEYEALGPEYELIEKLIKARQKAHISQTELARKLKLQQPAIARLERGGYASTSVNKLARVANALGYDLKISLQAKKRKLKV